MTGKYLVAEYQKIWDEYLSTTLNTSTPRSEDKLLERGFVFEFDEGLKDIDILFVGINPSYVNNKSETLFYRKEDVKDLSYFKPFNRIMEKLEEHEDISQDLTWSHLDMLVVRETQQSYITDHLLKTEEGIQFVYKQLMVSKQILEYLNPKIMVVSNTTARGFLGRDRFVKNDKEYGVWMGYEFEFDDEYGTDKIINNAKINPYVFFTSMLSGQRALDNGSKQRLIWHIRSILNKL